MAAPAFVAFSQASADSATVNVAAPSGLLAGDHQLVVFSAGSSSETLGATPAGWTLRADITATGTDSFRTGIYTSSTATGSAAFAKSGMRLGHVVRLAWRGGPGFVDAGTSATTASGTSHALPSQTATAADQLVVGVAHVDDGTTNVATTFTASVGWTERADTTATGAWPEASSVGVYEIARTGSGTQTGTVTSSRADVANVYAVILGAAAQSESRTATADTGTVTSSSYTMVQGEQRAETVTTGVVTAITQDAIGHTATAAAPTGVAASGAVTSVAHTGAASPTTGVATSSSYRVAHTASASTTTGVEIAAAFTRDSVSLPATGPLFFNFWVVDRATGAYVAPLPDYRAATVSPVFGEPGSITIDYPFDGINYDLLRDGVTHERDLEVAVWVGGRKDAALRAILMESDADVVAEQGMHRFGGHFLEVLMSEMVVLPEPANEKQETKFAAATAGTIVRSLVQRAQTAGYLTGITMASFSATTDSNGLAWGQNATAAWSPGRTYLDVLSDLADYGLCEWEITPDRELRVYRFGTRGSDLTVGQTPIILRRGQHLTDSPRKTSVKAAGTDLLAAGKEGLYRTESDASARARRGRSILRYASANGIEDTGALAAWAQAQLIDVAAGSLEQTHGLSFGKDDALPIADYGLGDWVGSDTGNPDIAFERLRVKQWTFAEDANGEITGSVSLNSLFIDEVDRLRRRVAAIEGGTAVVGTSTTAPVEDTMPPAAPTGLVATSLAYREDISGDTYASVTLGWAEVTLNADGTVADDVEAYRIRYKLGAVPSVDPNGDPLGPDDAWSVLTATPAQSPHTFSGVAPGVDIDIQVAAFDRSGNQGAWSATLIHHTAVDDTPPPSPSTPVVTDWFGTLRIMWDGLDGAGADMLAAAPDLDYVEVHVSAANNFTPSDATLTAQIFSATTWNVTDLQIGTTFYARLVAVDKSGNRSPASGVGSAVPRGIQFPDMGPDAIGSAQFIDASILTAHIGTAQIVDLHVNTVSVGKLTAGTMSADVLISGNMRTALTGSRVWIDGAGMRLYNAANILTVDLSTVTGNALITGEYRTSFTGARMVFNPGGTIPDELRFYPSSGSAYASISVQNHLGAATQAAIEMRGNSNRGDKATGITGAYPLEAFAAWGPGGGSPSWSAWSAGERSANAWGPMVRIQCRLQHPHEGGNRRIEFHHVDAAGAVIGKSNLQHITGSDGSAWVQNTANNSGWLYGPNYMFASGNTSLGIEVRAGDFITGSSRTIKDNIRDIGWQRPGGGTALAALDVVRGAGAKEWEYTHQQKGSRPARPGLTLPQERRDEQGRPVLDGNGRVIVDEVEVDWEWPEPETPKHYGPMAEDLRALVPALARVDPEDPAMLWTSQRDLLGVLWKAVEELSAQMDTLTARLERLPAFRDLRP